MNSILILYSEEETAVTTDKVEASVRRQSTKPGAQRCSHAAFCKHFPTNAECKVREGDGCGGRGRLSWARASVQLSPAMGRGHSRPAGHSPSFARGQPLAVQGVGERAYPTHDCHQCEHKHSHVKQVRGPDSEPSAGCTAPSIHGGCKTLPEGSAARDLAPRSLRGGLSLFPLSHKNSSV